LPDSATPAARLSPAVIAAGVSHLCGADARLASVIDRAGPCTRRPRGQIYRWLFRSILYQQLAGNAAAAIHRRVCACFGGVVPPPADFLRARPQTLRRAGLSRQKLAYLRDLAAHFADGRLRAQQLARLPEADLIAAVTAVHGVGEWTAHMLLLFSLGRPDVLPVGDYGVRKGMQRLYRLRELPKPPTMERIAAPWRPYRGIASWYLWRSIDMTLPDGGGS
jgi:DNA-3-methyladenine glycosylase II